VRQLGLWNGCNALEVIMAPIAEVRCTKTEKYGY
jgi:hypothetical protein